MNKRALAAELERLEGGENAWEASTETTERVTVKQPLSRVLQVRLTEDQWRRLSDRAHDVGVGPSTLLRMWTVERLRTELAASR